jgi:cadmium resistance protein CadD (predicted permease)
MNQWILLSGIAISVFISTNIDDLFLLITLSSIRSYRFRHIVAGQLMGMALIIAISFIGSWLAFSVPSVILRLLGLVPLGIGIKKLFQSKDLEESEKIDTPRQGYQKISAVTLITLANGGDNIGIYLPLFSARNLSENIFFSIVFLSLSLLWCWVSYFLVRHPTLQKPIRIYGNLILPWVLIGLGLSILIGLG